MAIYASIQELKNVISDTIYQNSAGLVTADILQDRFMDIIDTLDAVIPGSINGFPDIFGDPVAGQIAIWVDSNTLKGDSKITFIENTFRIDGNIITGGLHVGGTSDPGDNNALIDGTLGVAGISSFTGLIQTVGGIHIGGISDPGADNLIVDGTSILTGVATFGNDLGTASFSSGFAGAGWRMDSDTESSLTVDNLTVRKKMRVYELDINKINSINGGIMVSVANGKAYSVTDNKFDSWKPMFPAEFSVFTTSGLNITNAVKIGTGTKYVLMYDGSTSQIRGLQGKTITLTLTYAKTGTGNAILEIAEHGGSFFQQTILSVGVNVITYTFQSEYQQFADLEISLATSSGITQYSITNVSFTSDYDSSKIIFDEDQSTAGDGNIIQFAVNDYVRAQEWTGRNVNYFLGKVTHVVHSNTLGSAYIVVENTSGTPWAGADLVQVGNSSDTARQNMIYITASDSNNPYIDMLSGVTDGDFSGHQKLRIGNLTGITDAIFGALSGYGLWSDNAYLTGKLVLPNAGMTNEGSVAGSVRIYAGNTYANRGNAPFRVLQDGKMYSSAGMIGGWAIGATGLSSTAGGFTIALNSETGIITTYGIEYYNYSQQSASYSPTAANLPLYVCLDNNVESTFTLPATGLPGSGTGRLIIISHRYGTGLGVGKYHIQGNGNKIYNGGVEMASYNLDEGRSIMMSWEPRGNGWYIIGT